MRLGRKAWVLGTLLLAAVSAAGLAYVEWVRPEPGLRARVFKSHSFDGLPIAELADRQLSIDRLAASAGVPAGEQFGVQWTGWVFVPQSGRHAYDLWVDDGAEVWFGDRLVVEVKGPPGLYRPSGFADIERGVYPVEIRYRQFLGEQRFSFRWAAPDARESLAMPLFFQPSASPPAMAIVSRLPLAVALAWCAWIVLALAIAFVRFARISSGLAALLTMPRVLALALPLLLMAVGITWGSYPLRQWQPDEVLPADIIYAVEMKLAGGWARVYPPGRFMLDALVMSPLLIAERAAWVTFTDAPVLAAFQLSMRALTLVMAMLTLVMIHAIGRQTIGARRALAAVFFAGTGQVMAYYGKSANADLPYVFWTTAAMLFFIRAAKHRRLSDYLKLAIATALAIGTKDQAFGYFVVPATALIACSWRDHSEAGVLTRAVRTLRDRRLWLSAIIAIVAGLTVYGVPWNYSGFLTHVGFVTGHNTQFFRMFDSGPAGQLQLLLFTLQLLPWTFGVVTLLLAVAGVAVALGQRRRFRCLWLVVFTAAGYYVTAIMPVGFVYDRFLLGWIVAFGLLASLGFDALLRASQRFGSMRMALAAACLTAAVVPAVLVDTDLVDGSRQRIERWLDARTVDDPLVVAVANPLYLPRLSSFRHHVLNMVEDDLASWKGDLIVLNLEWVHRVPFPDGYVESLLRQGHYTEVYHDVVPGRPWWSRPFTGVPPDGSTNLLKVSPSFSVWELARPAVER